MNLRYYIKKVASMPPRELAKKVVKKIDTKVSDQFQKLKDLSNDTHVNFNVSIIKNNYVDIKNLNTSNITVKTAQCLSKMYCEHRFDLLGSGWVKNSYTSVALGVEGYKYEMNVSAPKSIANDYEPIDWQKDFKSGHRWDEKVWYKEQRIGHKLGSDIKVPWELSRLQHLPQLAIFAIVDKSLQAQNIKEFKYQVLDFIANNPPRMGVNWVCTMDVGIRAANMLVAYDLFMQLDHFGILDVHFKQTFANSIYEHGLHIINNLEYSEYLTSNHYLSDVAGLLYVSAYLECRDDVNQWLAFSLQEVINEMQNQFYKDGGNFESSTSYHRLSGELMIFSTALILGLKEDKIKALQASSPKGWRVKPQLNPLENQQFKINDLTLKIEFPQWYIDRLYKIGRFTVDITKPNNEIPQFGDNDSGRFFRFSPRGLFLTNKEAVNKYLNLNNYQKSTDLYWDENNLDHSTFTSCINGLYNEDIFKNDVYFEKSFIQSIAKTKLNVQDQSYKLINKIGYDRSSLRHKKSIIHEIKFKIHHLNFIVYPDSGIYVFKAENFYLAICATPLGQRGRGGHTHNDILSYELQIDGVDIEKDPGTYLYTPLPKRRNEFRSTKAHNVPIAEDTEQNSWSEGNIGLFALFNESQVFVIDYGKDFIELVLEYKDIKVRRKFEITNHTLEVSDVCNKEFSYSQFDMYSNGYGKILR